MNYSGQTPNRSALTTDCSHSQRQDCATESAESARPAPKLNDMDPAAILARETLSMPVLLPGSTEAMRFRERMKRRADAMRARRQAMHDNGLALTVRRETSGMEWLNDEMSE